jgi:hypothetical protein
VEAAGTASSEETAAGVAGVVVEEAAAGVEVAVAEEAAGEEEAGVAVAEEAAGEAGARQQAEASGGVIQATGWSSASSSRWTRSARPCA